MMFIPMRSFLLFSLFFKKNGVLDTLNKPQESNGRTKLNMKASLFKLTNFNGGTFIEQNIRQQYHVNADYA